MRSTVGIPCLQAGEDVKFLSVSVVVFLFGLRRLMLKRVSIAQ
jgi:hypothetical protein